MVIPHDHRPAASGAQRSSCSDAAFGAGPVIYVIARQVRKRRDSLDLNMAMHELPPE